MRKTIDICGTPCEFKSSAAIPMIYRLKYGRDLFVDMNSLAEKVNSGKDAKGASNIGIEYLEMFERIAYIMAKHANPSIPDNEIDWLGEFEMFDIYAVLPQIIEMWSAETKQTSIPKKRNEI